MTNTPEAIIEAALFLQTEPLSEKSMRELCQPPLSQDKLIDVLSSLKLRWQNRALQLVHSAEGWRFQIHSEAYRQLSLLNDTRTPRYSRAVMETLAIIAYQQPVTRGDIESIRGVAVSQNIMQTLQERGWIEIIGHRDSIGKPSLWATTNTFLSDLQLESLAHLPPLTELGELIIPELTQSNPEHTDSETESTNPEREQTNLKTK